MKKDVRKYRGDQKDNREGQEKEKPTENRFGREGSIRTICGGPHIGGESRNAMDRYVKEARQRPLTNVNNLSLRPPKVFKGEAADITFTEEDAKWVHHPHSDALVVNIRIGAMNVHRVFVDNGSSVNVLYYSTFQKMGLPDKDMTIENIYIYGFGGEAVKVKGVIQLPVTIGEEPCSVTQMVSFMIVDQESSHNALIGRPMLKDMRIVTSIYHLCMKFPTPRGMGCVKGCQVDSRECYSKAMKRYRKQGKCEGEREAEGEISNMMYTVEEPESDSEERSELRLALGGTRLKERAYTEKGKSVIACIEGAPCVTEVGESSGTKEEFDLDPRMPETVDKTGQRKIRFPSRLIRKILAKF